MGDKHCQWQPGMERDDLDTPALLIDLDVMDSNIKRMAAYFTALADSGSPVRLRPHIKTHKCPIIAHKQLQAGGTRGITCAKLGEAEVMVAAGIYSDVLIANQIIGKYKVARLMALAKHANLMVLVDNQRNVEQLSAAAKDAHVSLGVLVEVDVGLNRCGVRVLSEALRLAQMVDRSEGLELMGVHGFEGHLMGIPGFENRRAAVEYAMRNLLAARDAILDADLPVQYVHAGGTGTFNITSQIEGVTDIQAGTYVFQDASYYERTADFKPALTLLTTVISRPESGVGVLDIGQKSATFDDMILPRPKSLTGISIYEAHEEHLVINVEKEASDLRVGDKIEIIVGHACTTVNLHDRYCGMRNGVLEVVWDILARGRYD